MSFFWERMKRKNLFLIIAKSFLSSFYLMLETLEPLKEMLNNFLLDLS
jgi:hypothetical protein